MNIIVDNGAYSMRNMGDVAMLQACIGRIRSHAPSASIYVLGSSPTLLQKYCPGAIFVTASSRDAYYEAARVTSSNIYENWRRIKKLIKPSSDSSDFKNVLAKADRIVVAGGGYLNDLNQVQTRAVLRMLISAGRRGIHSSLFGQGLGPLDSSEFRFLLKYVFRRGIRIGLREPQVGLSIVNSVGACAGAAVITGDDALEMAWSQRSSDLGPGIGFSLRYADYSSINNSDCRRISQILTQLGRTFSSDLVPVPISFNDWEDDSKVAGIVAGQEAQKKASKLDEPSLLVTQAGKCRIMISGTYHSAVFALAQGIPTVCLYKTPYYRFKMKGLESLFPSGCTAIDLSQDKSYETIFNVAQNFWSKAHLIRPNLLESARIQIESSRGFYADFFNRA